MKEKEGMRVLKELLNDDYEAEYWFKDLKELLK